ncbi:MAG TPA: aldo/keto reductase [Terriglobia bacterium]|nr:aldo/keto reductase [Terriglobia bacterium]
MTPTFIYGTAWKKDATTQLVETAVKAGFKAIDTANQPKHYSEWLVGEALEALASEGISRDSLFLQTKFTPLDGHDDRVPYDPQVDLKTQVRQSFERSLKHLKTDRVDSYLLHGPYSFPGLGDEDWEVWSAIEELYRSGRTGMIGISNVNYLQLSALVERAAIKPMVVQNRCYANRGWDREVREICREHGIMYQGFSLLTANSPVLRHDPVTTMASKLRVDAAQVIFRFAMQVGMVPLTGTSKEEHMKQDLGVYRISLSEDEVSFIESIAG